MAGNDADSFTDQAVTNAFGSAATLTVTGVEIEDAIDNVWAIGDEIQATVTFSEAVDITGAPQLELDFDGAPKAAPCDSDTNTLTMACYYIVSENDSAPDGVAIAANKLTLNGGTITATGSTTINASLDHAAVAIDAGQKINGSRPTLVTTGPDAPRTSTDGTKVILTFSETLSQGFQTLDHTLFSIKSGTNTLSTTAASLTGTDQTMVELTLATALTASATNLTVALASEAVNDAGRNNIDAVAATPVINAVGATPTVTGVEFFSNPTGNGYAIDDIVEVAVTLQQYRST